MTKEYTDLVANFVDNFHNLLGQRRLLPAAQWVGDLASLRADVVVLLEDAPVALRHPLQLLLLPVPVVEALFCLLLRQLLQTIPR